MSDERHRPRWGSESAEGDATSVDEPPTEESDGSEPVDPLAVSLADGDAPPDQWSLSHSGQETDPELIRKLDALRPRTDTDVSLPAGDRVSNPFEALEDSVTDRLAGPPAIGPHEAPPIIGRAQPRREVREPAPAPPPVEPVPFDDPTIQEHAPEFIRTEEPSAPRALATPPSVVEPDSELWTRVGIGVGILIAALLTIGVIALIVAQLTAH